MFGGIGVATPIQKIVAFTAGRISRLIVVGVVSTTALVTAGGVFAFLTDSVVLTGAEVQSNGLLGEPIEEQMDLRVKYGQCDGSDVYDMAMFMDDPVIVFQPSVTDFDFTSIEANGGGESVVDVPPRLCLANAGDVRGLINLSVLTYESNEVGDCSDAELAAEAAMASPGCTDLSEGELAKVTDIVIREYCEGGDVGPYDSGAWDLWMVGNVADMGASGLPHSIGELAPGAACEIDLELLTRFGAVDDSLRMAQTDSLSMTLALDLVEF